MTKTVEDITEQLERQFKDRRTQERIARGEIPDPFAEYRENLRRIFTGTKFKGRLKQLSQAARTQCRKAVIRECVTWLHDRAKSMNDPHARDVLNSAALHLGETLGRDAIKEPAHV